MTNKLNKAYYTSGKFIGDTAKAAVNLGGKTALKQAIGFVLLEVWHAVKHRISKCNADSIKDFFEGIIEGIIEGIKTGFINAKNKYKEMITRIKDGFLSGIISSLMTTLTNMFITMLQGSIKIRRYAGSALVQAFKVLFLINILSGKKKFMEY